MAQITQTLQPGQTLTLTTDAVSSGSVVRLADSAGGEPFAPVAIAASGSLVLGPFTKTRRYSIVSDNGAIAAEVAEVDLPGATLADAAALTAVAFPAGGTGTAAGGWDTAGNRDLAIARFAALLADVTALRTTVNTLIARARAAGINL